MNPKAEIITIGDEILIGQTIDTNSAWLGERLSLAGIPVRRIVSIPDQPDAITGALTEALYRSELVIVTGGLGPTSDDRTKATLAAFFGSVLIEDEEVLENIRHLLSARNVPLSSLNRAQAMVPDNCRVLRNPAGTAPGMLFEHESKVVISLPGVPYEMKAIMENSVFPVLPRYFSTPAILHRTILTTGIAESVLSKLLEEWEKNLPDNFSLAYLPSPGQVRLRISGSGSDREILAKEIQLLEERLISVVSDYHYGYEQDTLEEVVGRLLVQKGLTVATAESCTGGNISRLLTRIPGSSQYFRGSLVAYANDVKTKFLNVSDDLLSEQGAVSAAVVEQMAKSCQESFKVDFAVATSGIAGPGGGTATKPVGTVWIAVAGRNGVVSERYQFGEHRERNILKASLAALILLRKVILKETIGS